LNALEEANHPKEPPEPPHKYTVDIMKEKYNKRIIKLFENEKTARIQEKELKKKHNRERFLETRNHENTKEFLKKKQELSTKHQERLKSLIIQRQLQEESIVERLNRTSIGPRKVKTVLKKDKPALFSLTSDDKEIELKLQEFNRKLLKSSENYTRNLNEKIENLKSLSRRRATLEDTDEYDQKLLMISSKHRDAFTRRNKLQIQLREKYQLKEPRLTQKSEKFRKSYEQEIESGQEELSEDNKKVDNILVSIKNRKKINLGDCKSEKMKKLEASMNEKLRNMKKEEFLKKERILEKHQMIEKKQKEYKNSLEIKNRNIRDKAMNFTIEKEKTSEIKYLVGKSQSPEELQKLLEKYKTQI